MCIPLSLKFLWVIQNGLWTCLQRKKISQWACPKMLEDKLRLRTVGAHFQAADYVGPECDAPFIATDSFLERKGSCLQFPYIRFLSRQLNQIHFLYLTVTHKNSGFSEKEKIAPILNGFGFIFLKKKKKTNIVIAWELLSSGWLQLSAVSLLSSVCEGGMFLLLTPTK